MNRIARYLAITAVGLALAACGKKDEAPKPAPAPPQAKTQPTAPAAPAGLAVTAITVGKSIGPDKRVPAATEFAKGDTMYAGVETSGAGSAKLDAKWTYTKDGKTVPVNESSLKLETMGPAVNEFHIAKPDGWPAGEYAVEIFLDGKSAGTKKITVK